MWLPNSIYLGIFVILFWDRIIMIIVCIITGSLLLRLVFLIRPLALRTPYNEYCSIFYVRFQSWVVSLKMVTVMQFYLKWCIVQLLHSTRGLLNFWLSIKQYLLQIWIFLLIMLQLLYNDYFYFLTAAFIGLMIYQEHLDK